MKTRVQAHLDHLLSAYLDKDLTPKEVEAVEAHLGGCAHCRGVLADLKQLTAEAKAIGELEPPASLWGRIEAELDRRAISWWEHLLIPRPALRPALVLGGTVLVLGTIAFWLFLGPWRGPGEVAREAGQEGLRAKEELARVELAQAEEHYQRAIAALEEIARLTTPRLDPELRSLYEEKLALLDQAIQQCKGALKESPFNLQAQKFLFVSYQQKLDTLQEMIAAVG